MEDLILILLLTGIVLIIVINVSIREKPLKIRLENDEIRFVDLPLKIAFCWNVYELTAVSERLGRKLILEIPTGTDVGNREEGHSHIRNKYIKINQMSNPQKIIAAMKLVPAFEKIHIGSKKRANRKAFRYFRNR